MTKAVPAPQPEPEPEPESKAKRHNRILFWILLLLLGGLSSWALAERLGSTEPVVDSVTVDSVAVVPVVVVPPPLFDHSRIDARLGEVEQQQRAVLSTLDTVLVVMEQFAVQYGGLDRALDRLVDGLGQQEVLTAQLMNQQVELARAHSATLKLLRQLIGYAHNHQERYHH